MSYEIINKKQLKDEIGVAVSPSGDQPKFERGGKKLLGGAFQGKKPQHHPHNDSLKAFKAYDDSLVNIETTNG